MCHFGLHFVDSVDVSLWAVPSGGPLLPRGPSMVLTDCGLCWSNSTLGANRKSRTICFPLILVNAKPFAYKDNLTGKTW